MALARFCSRRCSSQWVNSVPELKARKYNEKHRMAAGAGRKRFLASGSPEALRQIERIRQLRPTSDASVRRKISQRLKELGHRPKVRGGNGTGLTVPQKQLLDILGDGWLPEFVVLTKKRADGYPPCYKIDIAHPKRKIAIEVDGPTHFAIRVQKADKRKEMFLLDQGWIVLRFLNKQILDWTSSGMSKENYIYTTLLSVNIHPLVLAVS